MKKTRVSLDSLLEVVRSNGLDVKEKSAYYKCTYGNSMAKIYVAKTKKVTRVGAYGTSGKGSRQELDFTNSDEQTVLSSFQTMCEQLKTAPQREIRQAKTRNVEEVTTSQEESDTEE